MRISEYIKRKIRLLFSILMLSGIPLMNLAGTGDINWMKKGKYGIFMHYQYRILLGYSSGTVRAGTNPLVPEVSMMTSKQWNEFVNGFDVKKFADQMAKAKVGWVIFGVDDAYFGWSCAPNNTFNKYTGYADGEKCSKRDLIMDVTDALNKKGVKVILYYAGLTGHMLDPKIVSGLKDDTTRGIWGGKIPPSPECRKRRIEILRDYAERYKNKIAGWWFDTPGTKSYDEKPYDWWAIEEIVHKANPKAVISFAQGGMSNLKPTVPGIDDFTGGDTWRKQDLTKLIPKNYPAEEGILWHCKIYCGNIYHGQGDANQFTDQELIDWIKTCNNQGGVCTLDWPFEPQTGLIKDFGIKQMISISKAIK